MSSIRLKSRNHVEKLGSGLWVWSGDYEDSDAPSSLEKTVDVLDNNGRFLARGYFNPRSDIRVRILTRNKNESVEEAVRKRLLKALARRRKLLEVFKNGAIRLVHSEGDFLPGLTVDYYNGHLVLQSTTAGMDLFKPLVLEVIAEAGSFFSVYERSDSPSRQKEGVPPFTGQLSGETPDSIIIDENGVKFEVDVRHGQKTGFYIDMRPARQLVRSIARGRVLDAFAYNGAFSMAALSGGAESSLAIECSPEAMARLRKNAILNGFEKCIETREENAFDVLKEIARSGRKFELIIIDPPPFARDRRQIDGAIRGYKELALRAIEMLEDGGQFLLASCSFNVSGEMLLDAVRAAALDRKADLIVREAGRAGEDHPWCLAMPQSMYLKWFLFEKIS